MMKLKTIVFSTVLALSFNYAGADSYKLDKSHSNIGFSVKHMVISNVKGEFTEYSGEFEVDENDNITKTLVEIEAKSIFTKDNDRDKHLRTADFLDVEKFPLIKFSHKKNLDKSGKTYKVLGDLSIHGVTKEVELEMEMLGKEKDPWGNSRIGFTGKTAINRKDFGLVWNKILESGGLLVGEMVNISLEGEGILKKK